MKVSFQEVRIIRHIEHVQRCKDYYLCEILRHSNEWLRDYVNKQNEIFEKSCAESPDEANYFAEVYQEEVHDYELMDYNVVGSTIISIMSIFEQQCKKQRIDIRSVGNRIAEFRELANVIKHGKYDDARAYNALINSNSKFIKQDIDGRYINDNYSQLRTLNDVILNYSHNDFEECCDLLVEFWNDFLVKLEKTI
ncbi:MAG: hypothetical protein FWE84_05975 [Firmicutes bacterium]|nr:hypothetical protein [Bacillota bacterium]